MTKTILTTNDFESTYKGLIGFKYYPPRDWDKVKDSLRTELSDQLREGREIWYSPYDGDTVIKLHTCCLSDGSYYIHPDIIDASEVIYTVKPIIEDNDEEEIIQPAVHEMANAKDGVLWLVDVTGCGTCGEGYFEKKYAVQWQFPSSEVPDHERFNGIIDSLSDNETIYLKLKGSHQGLLYTNDVYVLRDNFIPFIEMLYVVIDRKDLEDKQEYCEAVVNIDTQHEQDSLIVYDMKLHQVISIGDSVVKRVPGGWIYLIPVGDESDQAVFVPWSERPPHNEGCVLCGHKA